MNFGQYLPDTESRIKRLSDLVKRPVGVMLSGASIEELEGRIEEFGDMCWASVNDFWIKEDRILSKVGKKCEVVYCGAPECDIPTEEHIEYLSRKTPNMFVSLRKAFQRDFDEVQGKYDDKLLFVNVDESGTIRQVPNESEPLHFRALPSFALLIFVLTIAGAEKVILFGADGGRIGDNPLYYGDVLKDMVKVGGGMQVRGGSLGRLMLDCRILNENFPQILRRVCKLYNVKEPEIINCSPESNYDIFKKMTYDETLEILK